MALDTHHEAHGSATRLGAAIRGMAADLASARRENVSLRRLNADLRQDNADLGVHNAKLQQELARTRSARRS